MRRYFADGMLPQWCNARTVMVCSPRRQVFKVRPIRWTRIGVRYMCFFSGMQVALTRGMCLQEWLKGRPDIRLTMPLWTWSEIKTLWENFYKDEVSSQRPFE